MVAGGTRAQVLTWRELNQATGRSQHARLVFATIDSRSKLSNTVSIEEAAAKLDELVATLNPGDEIVLTRHDRPVARIVPSAQTGQRRPGNCKGMLIIHEEDDGHLEDFIVTSIGRASYR